MKEFLSNANDNAPITKTSLKTVERLKTNASFTVVEGAEVTGSSLLITAILTKQVTMKLDFSFLIENARHIFSLHYCAFLIVCGCAA